MPAIAGHNSRVRIWPHKNPFNQGNDPAGFDYIDMMATRWQLTYRTEALDATTFEAPRNPLVTPMMTYVAGITDIEFTIDLLWDTDGVSGNPYGFPDLRPGTRPIIDLFVKKTTNNTAAALGMPPGTTPGLQGTPNPADQAFRFVAVIADCTTDSEVRGLVKYTISGNADPEILQEAYPGYDAGEYYSTGIWLPSFDDDTGYVGPAFSSQDTFHESIDSGVKAFDSTAGAANVKPNLHVHPTYPYSGEPPVMDADRAKTSGPASPVSGARTRIIPDAGKSPVAPTNPTPPAST